MNKKTEKICKDCGLSSYYHIQSWLNELNDRLLPEIRLPRKVEEFFDLWLEKFLIFLKLASLRDDFTRSDIQLRSSCFIDEFRGRGGSVKALRGPNNFTNRFWAEIQSRAVRFEGLPIANFASRYNIRLVDDKKKTKRHLEMGGFPIAKGQSFWFWQRGKALRFGVEKLGFPLVVKPRGGSVSRHVSTNIRDSDRLKLAIGKALVYSPTFIVEQFIADAFVHRVTVVDFNYVACVKQLPANILGDGVSSISELIDRKNRDPGRGEPDQKEYTLYKIVEDETTTKLLSERGYSLLSRPKKGEIVFLQRDPFLKLGGDLIELTPKVHPENLKLFRKIARFFDIRVVGIDFLAPDITRPYRDQTTAVLELNSLPCIELHHFPSAGPRQNVAKPVVDLFFKYYL